MFLSRYLLSVPSAVALSGQKIPPHAQYRKDVEAIFSYRLKVCEENEDVSF